eukprot:17648-Heterococcus_DN1.PRE.3
MLDLALQQDGCFQFDIVLPPTYPAVPPKVQFLTTGNGTVGFNPNLYDCGKLYYCVHLRSAVSFLLACGVAHAFAYAMSM